MNTRDDKYMIIADARGMRGKEQIYTSFIDVLCASVKLVEQGYTVCVKKINRNITTK